MAVMLVDGPPGSGKSFCCVRWMIDILTKTERPILTNITVRPAKLAAVACYFARAKVCMDTVREYVQRIHMIGADEIRAFWELPPTKDGRPYMRNAAVFLDELHMYFRSNEWKSAEDELTDFLAEHRKGGLDFYCISQSKDRILVDIRKMAEGCYFIRNSMTQSVYPGSWFGRVQWPIQFFQIKYVAAEGGRFRLSAAESETSLMPWGKNKMIFRAYESFAANSDFAALAGAEDLESGSHKDRGLMRNIMRQAVRCPAQFGVGAVIFAACIGAPYLVSQIDNPGGYVHWALGIGPEYSGDVESEGATTSGGGDGAKPAGSGRNTADGATISGGGVAVDKDSDKVSDKGAVRDMVDSFFRRVQGLCPEGVVMSDGAFYAIDDTIRIGDGKCRIDNISVSRGVWLWSYTGSDVEVSGSSRLRKGPDSEGQRKKRKGESPEEGQRKKRKGEGKKMPRGKMIESPSE